MDDQIAKWSSDRVGKVPMAMAMDGTTNLSRSLKPTARRENIDWLEIGISVYSQTHMY